MREIMQEGLPVAMLRLPDANETAFLQAFSHQRKPQGKVERAAAKVLELGGWADGRCIMLVGIEGEAEVATTTALAVGGLLRAPAGLSVKGDGATLRSWSLIVGSAAFDRVEEGSLRYKLRLFSPLWPLHVLRAVLFATGFSLYYAAFPFMGLAELTTIFFSGANLNLFCCDFLDVDVTAGDEAPSPP